MTDRRRFIAYAAGRVFAVAILAVFGILLMPGGAAAQSQVGTWSAMSETRVVVPFPVRR
jgi:hypothetical protein